MSEATPYCKALSAVLRRRDFYIVLALLAICSLVYYWGELVDHFGWESLHWRFFYTVHDVHRMLFLAPIIYAGYSFRVRGAVIVTLVTFIAILRSEEHTSELQSRL